MPGYVEAALEEFKHERPTQQQHAPLKMYHQTPHSDDARLLTKKEITFIQRVTGKFLYYARAVDCTMLHALNDIATKTVNGTTETLDAIKCFMDYASWHPDASVLFRASDMILHIESDGAHLTAPKSRSRAGGYHYLGNKGGMPAVARTCLHRRFVREA